VSAPAPAPAPRLLTITVSLVVVMAAIGFAFDIYELLMLPLILRPALLEFGIKPGSPEFATWRSLMFFLPAFAGGIFGLLGGYLTDLLGRRRVLTWSILLYAVSAFLCGLSTSLPMLLVFRSTKFIGVCVEFVAAVAWLAELFPQPQQRERVLGYTQAFSSFGGLLVAIAFELCSRFSASLPAIGIPEFASGWLGTIDPAHQHEAWRYTLMSGLIPAIPLVIIRPFLPESPAWAEKKAAGTLKRPSILEVFAPAFRRTTLVTTLMFAMSYGAAFGAIQMIPQIVPGLKDVHEAAAHKAEDARQKVEETQGTSEEAKKKADLAATQAQKQHEEKAGAQYTKMQEIGGLIGRFLLAVLAVYVVSRRNLLRIFLVPGLIIMPLVFAFFLTVENQTFFVLDLNWLLLGELPVTTMSLGVFLCGLVTVAQFSFWGNYLPLVYPVHLRGTGESFAANIGGRMIGTSFAALTSTLAVQAFIPGDSPPMKLTYTAAGVAFFVYAVALIASFWLPEPKQEALNE
jgi:MFS family permease